MILGGTPGTSDLANSLLIPCLGTLLYNAVADSEGVTAYSLMKCVYDTRTSTHPLITGNPDAYEMIP